VELKGEKFTRACNRRPGKFAFTGLAPEVFGGYLPDSTPLGMLAGPGRAKITVDQASRQHSIHGEGVRSSAVASVL